MATQKTNPKKKPATQMDVKHAEERGILIGVTSAQVLMFTVLLDKKGYSRDELLEIWNWTVSLSDSVKEGRVNISDLRMVLREEYGLKEI